MQRMSGVATQTAVYVKRLEGLRTKVLDTRKTTPGMRVLDKMAVKIGGGENHRMGLFDMILLKDNHIDPEMTRRAVEKVAGRCETESSGGITLDTMRDYAECGVDFISVGALTHQIKSLDMSLKACE